VNQPSAVVATEESPLMQQQQQQQGSTSTEESQSIQPAVNYGLPSDMVREIVAHEFPAHCISCGGYYTSSSVTPTTTDITTVQRQCSSSLEAMSSSVDSEEGHRDAFDSEEGYRDAFDQILRSCIFAFKYSLAVASRDDRTLVAADEATQSLSSRDPMFDGSG
jgi:hypothetical protein